MIIQTKPKVHICNKCGKPFEIVTGMSGNRKKCDDCVREAKSSSEAVSMSVGRRRRDPTLPKTPVFTEYDDQWHCGACRNLGHFCPLHEDMNDDGIRPPANIRRLI